MNRRNFIRNILVAGASFTILPGAGRIWRAERKPVILEFWTEPDYMNRSFTEEYLRLVAKLLHGDNFRSLNLLPKENPDNLEFKCVTTDILGPMESVEVTYEYSGCYDLASRNFCFKDFKEVSRRKVK